MKIKSEVVTTLIVSDLYHKPLVFAFIHNNHIHFLIVESVTSHVSLQQPNKMIVRWSKVRTSAASNRKIKYVLNIKVPG